MTESTTRTVQVASTAAWGVLACALTVIVIMTAHSLAPTLNRINTASATLLECRGNPACLPSQALAITGSVKAVAGAFAKATPEITGSIRTMAAASADASQETANAAKGVGDVVVKAGVAVENANGLVTDLRHDLNSLDVLIAGITQDAHKLLGSSDEAVKGAANALISLNDLELDLRKQLELGSPKAMQTLDSINQIVSDPAILNTLHHIDETSGSAASVVETVNISTLPLRKKVGQVKWLIGKIVSVATKMVTISLF